MRNFVVMFGLAVALSGCGAMGEFVADYNPFNRDGAPMMNDRGGRVAAAIGPARPETLLGCRGHVLTPAIGMTLVSFGGQSPSSGQFLREESLTPPYRVLSPGAAMTMDIVPSRLNINIDRNNRIVNLRCG